MADKRIPARRARTAEMLEVALGLLPDPDGPGTDDFQDYLSRNKLELAFNVLVEVGAGQRARSGFWAALHGGAMQMGLSVDAPTHAASVRTVMEWMRKPDAYPCPCCGHLVFDEPPGSHDICPVCFWEDDLAQLRWPNLAGGANRPCLIAAQANFMRLGACEEKLICHTRPAHEGEELDPGWRPVAPSCGQVEERIQGRDHRHSYATDPTVYYWRNQEP